MQQPGLLLQIWLIACPVPPEQPACEDRGAKLIKNENLIKFCFDYQENKLGKATGFWPPGY
ncbi:hypothetical protein DQQ10_16630 [Pseudochryseolinea flava]|uniref:Uncharacterized protein n=1 Tax=Pseudochryseolinea flava TaxID=2059302 RepID=A0A364Y073_9BACT|nr:hypothetical protein DQQ10_16630 [Pseudochryseolinea flava]